MTGAEIHQRTAAYERNCRAIRLHPPQWKLLLAFDGQRTLTEAATDAGLSLIDALPLAEKFLTQGWIDEQALTLDQFLKRTGSTEPSAIGGPVPPAVVLHEPKPGATPPPLPVTAPKTADAIPVGAPGIVPATPAPPSTPPPLRGPMRLSAVVDYVTSLVGNINLGQMLVYRVFLRVPPELLQAEEIVSVRLVNDTCLIRTAALQQAIADAVSEVAKRPLPDGVYATA